MVDPDGRRAVVEVLRHAATSDDVAVAHVTHRVEECAVADRVVALDEGRMVATAPRPDADDRASTSLGARWSAGVGDPLLSLRGVGYEYATRTPWAHRALRDIDLELAAGEGLLVLGHNGSGKSTLAWILAGVLTPTEGTATLSGRALTARVGHVGLAFQHARLQLLRSTVASDVAAASGADQATVVSTLDAVGLDPARFADRRVDELSGGEMRRAALAGILAGHPRVLVLDEPFAGLDEAGRSSLADLLVDLRTNSGMSVVVVSHDDDLPERLVDRVVQLEHGAVIHESPFRRASVGRAD
jgi:energy-coupling factor transport system ATP-binding protein